MESRTCDLLIKVTPANGGTVAKAIKLLVDAHAISVHDAEEVIDCIECVDTMERLNDIQKIFDSIKAGRE